MSTAKAWEPIIHFPDDGTYTVVLNLGGIGGTGAASVTFDARDHRGEGYRCATAGSPATLASFLAFAVSMGLLRGRRFRGA